MDESIKSDKNEKPVLVSYTSTNEIDVRQAVHLIIESHSEERSCEIQEEYREAL